MARAVGRDCNLDLIIDDIREELRGRPYKLVKVAGGWQHRTRKSFGDAIWVATRLGDNLRPLSLSESLVLTCIAYDSDGRRVMLEIAPAGREMLCKVTPDSAKIFADLEANFGKERFKQLVDLLETFSTPKA